MWSSLLSNEAIITMVGHEAFARGLVYARNGQVTEVQIDPATQLVTGRVQGGYRDGYDTSVQLVGTEQGWTGHRGQCSCPVAQDCKHTAALLIVARTRLREMVAEQRPAWEVALDRLTRAPAPVTEPDVAPLGLEFSLERMPTYRGQRGKISLRMRPVRRGHRGAWVRSGISWEELDYPSRSHPAEQRDLLLQIRTAAGAAARFTLPRNPWLSLSEVSAGFWSLLADADRIGLSLLVEGAAGRPPLITKLPAEMVLDARRFLGELVLEPTIMVDGQPLRPGGYGLLGDPVHGLYLCSTATELPGPELTLAQLAEPLTREQRRLVADGTPIAIPAADEGRFLTDYLPAVRRRAGVVSADGSVDLPDNPAPVLCLTVAFRPEHRIRLDWSVRYSGSGTEQTFALDAPVTLSAIRDRSREDALVRALPLPYGRIPVLADEDGTRPAAHALLAGGDAAVFVDQVLPDLEASGVLITLQGERVSYRPPSSEPVVEVATHPTGSADWFDLQIRVQLDTEVVPFEEIFVALNSTDEFLITESGVYVPLDRPELGRLRELIDEAKLLHDRDQPGLRINRVQLGLWDELVQLGVVLGQADRWLDSVRSLIESGSSSEVEVPETLRVQLRPYQEQGFRWLTRLWAQDLGGVLADDMGLGKTVQTLALICRARAERPDDPPFLVVAPTSVVSNWAAEIQRFAPSLSVVEVDGSRAARLRALATRTGADVVVTSYALLRLDVDLYANQSWAGMILDEAQFVKNHRGRTYAAARLVPAGFKLAITGTPVENNLMDLWSLFSLTAPGLFPHPDRFAEYYRRPIERDGDAARLAQLRRRIDPFLLRRTKEAVEAELPAKQEQVVEVVLQPRHQRIYQTHLQRERQKVLGLIDDVEGNRFTILRSLTLLRQLSLDPVLVDEQHAGAPASKTAVLLAMLDELVGEGHQALVFSQFVGFLDRVAARLSADGVSHVRLDGRTRARAQVIDRFRRGEARVFLISLKAGGFGLNLTEADYCFVLDPWWNPAAEAQAVDRAHRIGQTRPVMVYRLVASGTIEEKVMDLKARKQRLVEAVLSDDALGGGELGAEDIRELLDL